MWPLFPEEIAYSQGAADPIREVAEAIQREPCLREGLRRQVERRVTIATPREVEAVDPLGVPVVELAERRRIGLRAHNQLCVRLQSALRF